MSLESTRKEQVVRFLIAHPGARSIDIADGIYIANSSACTLLKSLTKDGIVIRLKQGRHFRYSITQKYIEQLASVEDDIAAMELHRKKLQKLERIAEELESRGLPRRASTVWAQLTALQNSDIGVAIIAGRRNKCASAFMRRARA